MPRKTSGKNAKIEVRCSELQKERWQDWSERNGKDLSEWMRDAADAYYRQQVAEAAELETVEAALRKRRQ